MRGENDHRRPIAGRPPRLLLQGLLLALLLLGTFRLSAQMWSGGAADDYWSSATNWNPVGVPNNNGTARIVFAGTTRLTPSALVTWDVLGLFFTNNAGAFILGGNQLTLRAAGITNNSVNLQRINNSLVMATEPPN